MKNLKLRRFTATALLIGIIVLMGMVPYLGYIPVGPIKLTLICIPVIIGTLALGLGPGLILGFVFGITSFIQIWYPGDWMGLQLINISLAKALAVIFIPRLLVPVVTYYVWKLLNTDIEIYVEIGLFALFTVLGIFVTWVFLIPAVVMLIIFVFLKKIPAVKVNYGIAALFGSLTNTAFFLGGIYLLYLNEPVFATVTEQLGTTVEKLGTFLTAVALSNGLPEAVLALFLTIPILIPLNQAGLTIGTSRDIDKKGTEQ